MDRILLQLQLHRQLFASTRVEEKVLQPSVVQGLAFLCRSLAS